MEKAVTALFNQLLLLFSIMQGINAEPLTQDESSMKPKAVVYEDSYSLNRRLDGLIRGGLNQEKDEGR